MNRLKEEIEKEEPKVENASKSVSGVKDVLSGNFLSKDSVVNVLPFLFFLTFFF